MHNEMLLGLVQTGDKQQLVFSKTQILSFDCLTADCPGEKLQFVRQPDYIVCVPASNTTIEVAIMPVPGELATLERFARALLENNILDGGLRVCAWNKRNADHRLVVIMRR